MVDTVGFANGVGSPLVPTYNGRQARQLNAVSLPMGDTSRPLGALSGVRAGTPTTTVTATSTTWTCQAFAGEADVMTAKESGPYPFSFDAVTTGTMTAADASNPRKDIIYVKITDPENGSTVPKAERLYLAGTAAGTPSAPAAPAGGFTVAEINVPKATTGSPTVTWVATEIGPGAPRFQTLALLQLWTSAAAGQLAYVAATKRLYQNVNGNWAWALSETWRARKGSGQNPPASTMTSILTLALPADAPVGLYRVKALPFTWSGAQTTHFRRVSWGATVLDGGTTGLTVAAGIDFCFPGEWTVTHTGGAVTVDLSVQVNGGTPSANAETTLVVDYIGPL